MRMVVNPEINHRNKHINAHYHYSRERIESGNIDVLYVPSLEQIADILMKPLGCTLFVKFRALLSIQVTAPGDSYYAATHITD
jgi:hypothetical protein